MNDDRELARLGELWGRLTWLQRKQIYLTFRLSITLYRIRRWIILAGFPAHMRRALSAYRW